jgi:membrane associated rhomboid family serine protease
VTGDQAAPPTCYRHPDRETWVRCTRCERPICPDCMRAASVGFQCPDDVAAGAKTVRQGRTVFGGRVSGDTSRVTIALVALNVLVFVVGLAVGERSLQIEYGNVPGPVLLQDGVGGVATGEYYRLITAAFLHAGVFHLAMNMFALATLGPVLESALGRSRFLALYLLSALGGSTLSFLLSSPGQFGVGASGAIFGLFGAYYVVVRRLGGETRSIVTLLVINLVITFAVPIIDWRAHLGGLLTGAVIAAAFAFVPKGPRRTAMQASACAVVLVVLVGIVAARTAMLGG